MSSDYLIIFITYESEVCKLKHKTIIKIQILNQNFTLATKIITFIVIVQFLQTLFAISDYFKTLLRENKKVNLMI